MDDLERCESAADLRANDGQRAVVVGVYEQVDVRKSRPGADRDPEYRGHAAVGLSDGTLVHLQPTWAKEAIRSERERERFEGERVYVRGRVHRESPEPPEPVAFLEAACVRPVERIDSVE